MKSADRLRGVTRLVSTVAVITILLLASMASSAFAGVAGPAAPSAASGTNWTGATNVTSSDDADATYNGTAQNNLVITGFGFAIPAGATINGIVVEVEGSSSGASAADRQYRIALTKNGSAAVGTAKSAQQFTTADSFVVSGSASDLWGTTWTAAELNAGTFGLLLADNDTTANGSFSIDFARITVVYSVSGWVDSPMLHNSNRFSGSPDKWGGSGWGIPSQMHGPIVCSTCHQSGTTNIKRIKTTITSPSGDNWPEGDPTINTVTFTTTDEGANPTGTGFGNDSGGHGSSVRVCEVCHSQTDYHRYDTTGQVATDHYNNTDCISCHQHSTGFMASCAACHNANNTLADSHPAHYNTAAVVTGNFSTNDSTQTNYIFQCGNCHDESGTVTHDNGDANPGIQAAEVDLAGTGTYTPDTVKAGDDVGGAGTFEYTAGSCNTNDCHNDGAGGAPNTNPTWTGSLAADCTGCHDNNATAAQTMGTDAHGTHINDGSSMSNVACNTCHNVTVDGTDRAIADKRQHIDGGVDVDIIAALDSDANTANNFAANACNNVYCHSDGQSTPTYQSINWTTGSITDCVSCHEGASAGTGLSGAHEAHVFNATATVGTTLTCNVCHGATVSNNTTISTPAQHVDGGVDVITCTTNDCHSDGNFGNLTHYSPNFASDTLGCDDCHGDGAGKSHPVYADGGIGVDANTHVLHVETNSISCDECHALTSTAGTTLDGTTPSEHVDGNIDVSLQTGSFAPASDTCSTTYCHGAGTPQWGGSISCGDCHAADKTLPQSHAEHYNSSTLGTRVATKTNEGAGTYVFQCDSCHDGVTHVDGNKDVSLHANWGGSINGSLTCSSVYCHSDGDGGAGNVNPQWAVTAMNCGSCHDAEPATARHTKHVANATYDFNCAECHTVTTTDGTSINNKYQHVDNDKDVDWAALNSGGDAYVDASTSCSNLYCHSDGQGGAPLTAVQWDTVPGAFGCNDCHDEAKAGTTLSGAHAAHFNGATLQTIGTAVGCAVCHTATVSDNTTISDYAQHVDGGVDVIDCSTNLCHSDGNFGADLVQYNPTFDTDTLDCFDCHGDGASKSHPTYANGGPADDSSNTHVAHVETSAISCEECHANTTTVGTSIDGADGTQHVDGGIDVAFKQTGSYNDGTDTCSTTYCHGAGTPVWGGASLNCDACHNASNALDNSHGAHYEVATVATAINANNDSVAGSYVFQCGNCHDSGSISHAGGAVDADQSAEVSLSGGGSYTPDTGTTAGTDNGFTYTAGTCGTNACHQDGTGGAPNVAAPQWSVDTLDCTGCHNSNAAATGNEMATGAHTSHMDAGTAMTDKSCQTCHDDTMNASDVAIGNKSFHVNGAVNVAILGTYDGGNTFTSNSCDAVYCHSDGKSTPNYAVAIDWDAGSTNCTSCHGGANGSNGGNGAVTALTDSHTVHTGPAGSDRFGYTCDDCHAQTATNNTTIGTPANHVNQARDVAVSAANGGTGTIGGDFSGGSCATTTCHGSTTPDWTAGATTLGNCSACHGMEASATDDRDTNGDANDNTDPQVGMHEAHLNSSQNWSSDIGCAECHKTTVDNQTAAGTYVAKVNAAGHLDGGTVKVVFGSLATYNSATPNYAGGPGGTCATSYCHDGSRIGKGWSGTLNVPDWNTSYFTGVKANDCSFCHGYPPNPANGHPNDADCSACHTNTVANDDGFTDVSKHLNGIVETEGGDNCIDCHGSGKYKDPVATNPDHADHTNVTAFLTGKTISGGDFGDASTGWYDVSYDASSNPVIGCGQCHPADEATYHRNSNVDTKLTATGETNIPAVNAKNHNTGTAAFSAGQCSGVYCHSDGEPDGTYANSPTWGSGTIGDCTGCHANGPSTGTHANHAVGIHAKTLYDGTNALMAESGTNGSGAAHGDENASDPIGCQSCHNSTVSVTFNSNASACVTCHSGNTGSPAIGDERATIRPSSSAHIDGAKSVVFDDFSSFKSRAQVRDDITGVTELNDNWGRNNGYKASNSFDQGKVATPSFAGGTCSNVSCHNGITTPSWGGGFNMDCAACHTSVPQ